MNAETIADRLNTFAASAGPADCIWNDCIYYLDEYDVDATDALAEFTESGNEIVALVDGSIVEWFPDTGWVARLT